MDGPQERDNARVFPAHRQRKDHRHRAFHNSRNGRRNRVLLSPFLPRAKAFGGKRSLSSEPYKSDANTFRFDNPVVNQLKDAIITHNADDSYTSHGDITGADG